MAEPQRIYALSKVQHISDAKHVISKAKTTADEKGCTGDEKIGKVLANTPPYLKERVQGGQVELPRDELRQPFNEGEKRMMAVMKYVLQDEGEYPEDGGMLAEVFVELLEMMAPKWDPIRGGAAGGGASAGGGAAGGGAAGGGGI
jgi:hypothetical protein